MTEKFKGICPEENCFDATLCSYEAEKKLKVFETPEAVKILQRRMDCAKKLINQTIPESEERKNL